MAGALEDDRGELTSEIAAGVRAKLPWYSVPRNDARHEGVKCVGTRDERSAICLRGDTEKSQIKHDCPQKQIRNAGKIAN